MYLPAPIQSTVILKSRKQLQIRIRYPYTHIITCVDIWYIQIQHIWQWYGAINQCSRTKEFGAMWAENIGSSQQSSCSTESGVSASQRLHVLATCQATRPDVHISSIEFGEFRMRIRNHGIVVPTEDGSAVLLQCLMHIMKRTLFLTQVVNDSLTKLEDGNATEEARVNCPPHLYMLMYLARCCILDMIMLSYKPWTMIYLYIFAFCLYFIAFSIFFVANYLALNIGIQFGHA